MQLRVTLILRSDVRHRYLPKRCLLGGGEGGGGLGGGGDGGGGLGGGGPTIKHCPRKHDAWLFNNVH